MGHDGLKASALDVFHPEGKGKGKGKGKYHSNLCRAQWQADCCQSHQFRSLLASCSSSLYVQQVLRDQWSCTISQFTSRHILRYCSRKNYVLFSFMVGPLLCEWLCKTGCIVVMQQALRILRRWHSDDQCTVCWGRPISVWVSALQQTLCIPVIAAGENQ